MPDRKDSDDEKETIYVPVVVRDEYEPFSERHPRRRWHVATGLLFLALALAVLALGGALPREIPGFYSLGLALTLALLGALTLTEGLLSPLSRASAIVHVAAAALSVLLAVFSVGIAWLLFWVGSYAAAGALLLIAATTVYRLVEHRKSTREAWAVARKGVPDWWRTGRRPGNGKD